MLMGLYQLLHDPYRLYWVWFISPAAPFVPLIFGWYASLKVRWGQWHKDRSFLLVMAAAVFGIIFGLVLCLWLYLFLDHPQISDHSHWGDKYWYLPILVGGYAAFIGTRKMYQQWVKWLFDRNTDGGPSMFG